MPKSSRARIRTLAPSHDQEGCFFSGSYPFNLRLETEVGTGQVRVGEPPSLGRVDFSRTRLPPDPSLEIARKEKWWPWSLTTWVRLGRWDFYSYKPQFSHLLKVGS